MAGGHFLKTQDGRKIVVCSRFWRRSNPHLRERLVCELMDARRTVRVARGDAVKLAAALAAVNTAKIALGERGRSGGTTALQTTSAISRNTPYGQWFRTATAR